MASPVSNSDLSTFRSDPRFAPQSPALGTAFQRALEDAHAELRRTGAELEQLEEPSFDPIPTARATERALAALFDAFDGRGAPLEAVEDTTAAIDDALTALKDADPRAASPLADHLLHARSALERAMAAGATSPIPHTGETPPLRASIDVPRLHAIRRASIVPPLDVKPLAPVHAAVLPPPIAAPRSFAELKDAVTTLKDRSRGGRDAGTRALSTRTKGNATDAAKTNEDAPSPPEGFAREIDAAMGELAFLHDRTRTCFEEVAMVGMQRTPLLGDPWRGSLLLERRMLASIDVIASIGAIALAHVPRLVADAPIKDASRAFAAGMILGSFAGRDTLAAAERMLFSAAELDPAFVAELGAALSIAPHDLLPLSLRTLLREDHPALRAMAIDVLGKRGLATREELVAAIDDVPEVASRALVHLATSFGVVMEEHVKHALASEEQTLREAALSAIALAGDARLLPHLVSALDGPDADAAAILVAIAGEEDAAKTLLERVKFHPTRASIAALGWAGPAMGIGALFDLLESDRAELRIAAAWALERITGAGLFQEVEMPAEEIDVVVPPSPDVGEPPVPRLVKVVSDPRDEPERPAPDVVEQPTTDLGLWRSFWREHHGKYDPHQRYRMGHPYTPLVSLRELDAERRTPEERRLLQQELVIRTGSLVRFDPRDFVVVQESALRDWQGPARAASSAPSRWTRPPRKSS